MKRPTKAVSSLSSFIKPQLATLRTRAPKGDYLHEIRYDGYRVQIHIDGENRKSGLSKTPQVWPLYLGKQEGKMLPNVGAGSCVVVTGDALLRWRPARCRNAGGIRAQSTCNRESRRRRRFR